MFGWPSRSQPTSSRTYCCFAATGGGRLVLWQYVRWLLGEPTQFVLASVVAEGVPCGFHGANVGGAPTIAAAGGELSEPPTPPLSLVAELYTIEILVRESG